MFSPARLSLEIGPAGKFPEYVKVCSLYGAGFYYIPGTDICLKLGGYMRFQQSYGHIGNNLSGPHVESGFNNREFNLDHAYRVRAIMTIDTRQQTAYGTLRTYLLLGYTHDSGGANAAATLYATRGFIQIAGFTFGKATSFFDFVSTAAVAYNSGSTHTSDTGDGGWHVAAYTAQFGNGVSATISAEQDRRRATDYLGLVATGAGSVLAADEGNTNLGQNIVGNIRVDQAWGSAQIAAAIRNASGSYYGNGLVAGTLVEWNGHPGDEWGWAVSAGLRLNAPMIGPGDYFQIQGTYAKGATRYASHTPTSALISNGQSVGFSIHNDGGFTGTAAAPGIFELTTAWSVFASYEHFWTPSLRTSIYGSYLDISRPDGLNNAMCLSGAYGFTGTATTRAAGCDFDSSQWNVGSRSQWNVTKDLYIGIDVLYVKMNSGTTNLANTVTLPAGNGKAASASYTVSDQDAWIATWRIHRDIVP